MVITIRYANANIVISALFETSHGVRLFGKVELALPCRVLIALVLEVPHRARAVPRHDSRVVGGFMFNIIDFKVSGEWYLSPIAKVRAIHNLQAAGVFCLCSEAGQGIACGSGIVDGHCRPVGCIICLVLHVVAADFCRGCVPLEVCCGEGDVFDT